ncbi:MAG: glycyl-radical enzyme activating protein [Lachnospiraceae bacterium]|nr:glycyl-radical enzyme activating protein [Lachnospiraceae bacterium]
MNKERTGHILRIEYSSIHDGPGLRTVLFLKGCPLRCRWCSTPESHRQRPEHGYRPEKCVGCGKCAALCPQGALRLEEGKIVCDKNLCTECMRCAFHCPKGAYTVYGQEMTVSQALEYVLKDELFFFYSGGGVTLSGGEVTAQADFAAEILRECRRNGIHTAIETSCCADYAEIQKLLPYVNLMMADIKMMDSEKHLFWTGIRGEKILENLCRIDASDYEGEIVIRIPLIPGVNDSDDNLRRTVAFCNDLKKIKGIEVLPYHELGKETYLLLGREYPMTCTPMSHEKFIERLSYVRAQNPRVPVTSEGE